jgi:hypothetical protein
MPTEETPPQQPVGNSWPVLAATVWDWTKGGMSGLSSIHPGHVFLVGSLPFCVQAYRGYQRPLDPVVQDVLKAKAGGNVRIEELKLAEEYIRRSVGSAVALRALRVATLGSFGVFGMAIAGVFYASGCSTTQEAMVSIQKWAHSGRKQLDRALGIRRVDFDHPEYLITQTMTEEEELEHVSKTYFPDEDWEDEADATRRTTKD